MTLKLDREFATEVKKPENVSALYALRSISSGFKREFENITVNFYNIRYKKKDSYLTYFQRFPSMFINLDNEEYQSIVIDNKQYYYLTRGKYSKLVWYQNEFQHCLEGEFTLKQLLKISNTLEVIQSK